MEDVQQNARAESGERILGTDPKSGRQVSVRLGKFGPMVQIGKAMKKKSQSLRVYHLNNQLSSITYEEAMDLFQLPKDLGKYKGEDLDC